MEVLPILFFVVIGILVIAGIWYGVQRGKKRRQALGVLAGKLGMSFDPEKRRGLAEELGSRFATLTQGSNRYAYNILAGRRDGRAATLFDFHHETYSTDSKGNRQTHHHHRSFVIIEHDVNLGALEARPEHFFDKLKGFFGFDDIDFESAEFSKAYYVKAKDRKLAYDLFHPRMIEFMLAHKGLKVTTWVDHALFRYGSGRMTPLVFEGTLRDGFAFLEQIPRYMRKDRAIGGTP